LPIAVGIGQSSMRKSVAFGSPTGREASTMRLFWAMAERRLPAEAFGEGGLLSASFGWQAINLIVAKRAKAAAQAGTTTRVPRRKLFALHPKKTFG
jgi:hypothetical protein